MKASVCAVPRPCPELGGKADLPVERPHFSICPISGNWCAPGLGSRCALVSSPTIGGIFHTKATRYTELHVLQPAERGVDASLSPLLGSPRLVQPNHGANSASDPGLRHPTSRDKRPCTTSWGRFVIFLPFESV